MDATIPSEGSPQSQPLVRSLSLDPNSHLQGPQAEPTGGLRISEEVPMPSKKPPGLKPQVPPKPSHLCRTRLLEPIPPAPRRPLPADPRGAQSTPGTGRQAGTLARVSTLIDKFEREQTSLGGELNPPTASPSAEGGCALPESSGNVRTDRLNSLESGICMSEAANRLLDFAEGSEAVGGGAERGRGTSSSASSSSSFSSSASLKPSNRDSGISSLSSPCNSEELCFAADEALEPPSRPLPRIPGHAAPPQAPGRHSPRHPRDSEGDSELEEEEEEVEGQQAGGPAMPPLAERQDSADLIKEKNNRQIAPRLAFTR
ncbi:FYVE, RhoGEF and PH domain-containing protein 1-like [Rhincodon typus]|uniref:FYVE, RhoGEF and PH domain-containing protein 1-like n=1 Tax=Rhincodon typus TaxID=259920 RepID=UPI00203017EC|nr:FYVE, RhoGEF and PH domain-containing protein 1-like [Rhincodon typus]